MQQLVMLLSSLTNDTNLFPDKCLFGVVLPFDSRKNSSFVPSECGCIKVVPRWGAMVNAAQRTGTCLLGCVCCSVHISTCKRTHANTDLLIFKFICFYYFFALQFLRNEVDHHGRSSRSPVMLFDIQENNNVNSFAVSRCRIAHQPLWVFSSIPVLNPLP